MRGRPARVGCRERPTACTREGRARPSSRMDEHVECCKFYTSFIRLACMMSMVAWELEPNSADSKGGVPGRHFHQIGRSRPWRSRFAIRAPLYLFVTKDTRVNCCDEASLICGHESVSPETMRVIWTRHPLVEAFLQASPECQYINIEYYC